MCIDASTNHGIVSHHPSHYCQRKLRYYMQKSEVPSPSCLFAWLSIPDCIQDAEETPGSTQGRTDHWIPQTRDQKRRNNRCLVLKEVGVSTLCTIEQVFLLRGSGLVGRDISVRVRDLCGSTVGADNMRYPEIEERGRGSHHSHVTWAVVSGMLSFDCAPDRTYPYSFGTRSERSAMMKKRCWTGKREDVAALRRENNYFMKPLVYLAHGIPSSSAAKAGPGPEIQL